MSLRPESAESTQSRNQALSSDEVQSRLMLQSWWNFMWLSIV